MEKCPRCNINFEVSTVECNVNKVTGLECKLQVTVIYKCPGCNTQAQVTYFKRVDIS